MCLFDLIDAVDGSEKCQHGRMAGAQICAPITKSLMYKMGE